MAIGNWLTSMLGGGGEAATQPASYGSGPQGQGGVVDALQGGLNSTVDTANKMFENPNFLKFLAETGTALDPQGLGGALGQPTSNWIERQQQPAFMDKLIKSLGPGGQLKIKPDGGMDMKRGGEETGTTPQKQESELGSLEDTNVADVDPLDSFLDDMMDGLIGGLNNAK